ncbi:MAG: hypothetical protein ACRD1T_27150 [Acidimicrobiia bacterium]
MAEIIGLRHGRLGLAAAVILGTTCISAFGQSSSVATFKSGVSLVTVSAVVRDDRGRFVANLARRDFEVLEAGRRRPIIDFRVDETAPVSLLVLFDVSGSMQDGSKLPDA